MQVSSLDTVLPSGNEKDVSKPATAASDAFAILLQSSLEPRVNPGLLRLADASGLARELSASRESFAESRPIDDIGAEEPVKFDDGDIAPALDEGVACSRCRLRDIFFVSRGKYGIETGYLHDRSLQLRPRQIQQATGQRRSSSLTI